MRKEEQSITIAAKLYELRRTVRTLLGDRFKPKMAEFAQCINTVAVGKDMSHMEAALLLAKVAEEDGESMTAMMMLAAAVEATEPTPITNTGALPCN